MKKYKNILLVVLVVGIFYVNARIFFQDSPEVAKNVENINRVQNGMSRQEVIRIMGEPKSREYYSYEEVLIYTSQVGMSGDYEIGISTKDKKVYRIYHGE